jgi:hypothetical protein
MNLALTAKKMEDIGFSLMADEPGWILSAQPCKGDRYGKII